MKNSYKVVFFGHESLLDSHDIISRQLKQIDKGIKTILWTLSDINERRGKQKEGFTRVVNLKPDVSSLNVTKSDHRSNLKWASKLEESLNKVFFHKDLSQDRYFCGKRYTDIKYSEIQNIWGEERVYAYIREVVSSVSSRIKDNTIDLMWTEANFTPYRIARRLCRQQNIPAVFFGRARMWGGKRGYLERANGIQWQECRSVYKQFIKGGIPYSLRKKCTKRLDEIRAQQLQPRYHTHGQSGKKSLWERLNVQRVFRNLYYWWKCRKEPWREYPRHLPSHIQSPIGQIKRFIRTSMAERYYHQVVCKEPDIDREYAVYFLHVQPEITVEAMAFEYQDQVATIRNLVAGLPANVPLYVKEHSPMVGQRRKAFYAELSHIPGVRLVSDDIHPFTLIKNAIIVLTLTGTVGLEAITQKTPAITLGNVFYDQFNGVYSPKSIQEVQSLLNNPHNLKGASDSDALRMLAATYEASSPVAWPPDLESRREETKNLARLIVGNISDNTSLN